MKRTLLALLCGTIFGAGLELSQMTNPAKVQNFLDLFGTWDPSLAFVMGGALLVSTAGTWLARRRPRPWLAPGFAWPTRYELDLRLVGGAALFGAGWGLVGFCPGPALAGLYRLDGRIVLFVVAMLVGIALHRLGGAWLAARPREAASAGR